MLKWKILKKIPDITNLAYNISLNDKINEVKNEVPNIANLATTTALTAVENKIPNVSNLVINYNISITQKLVKLKKKITIDHNHKYITTQEFNKLRSEHFIARLKQANLASKNDIANLVKIQIFIIN